jgi:hypothetical protein
LAVRNFLARRTQVDAALPVEPVGTVVRRAAVPALATIELGKENQEAIVRSVQMPGQLDDLIRELVRRADVGAAFFEGRE